MGCSECPFSGAAQGAVPESPGGPLDFLLNEEQLHLKKSVREFAEREIKPNVMKWDEAGEFPLATIKELGKLGMLGMVFPPEYGGAGMGYVEYVTAIEELSRVDGSVGIIVAAHTSLCSNHIFVAGNEDVIRAQRSVRRHNDAHRTIHPRQLFDGGDVLDVAHAGAAVLGGKDGAHQPQLAQLLDGLQREGTG